MLITETITIEGINYLRNYSDAGFRILQTDTGFKYDETIDPADNPLGHSYTETNEPIEDGDTTSEEEAYAEAGRILLGQEG